jgi:tetratricopeptide (TPR) repeat protein
MVDLTPIFQEGNDHYLGGRYQEARLCYEKILSVVKDNVLVWHNLGLTCNHLGDYEAAVQSFEYPITKEYAESYIGRGAVYRAMGKYKEAMRDFAMAFVIDPYNGIAYSNYANSLREFGKPQIAVPFLQTAIALNDSDEQIKLNLSISYLAMGEFDKAWEHYDSRWYFNANSSFKPRLPRPEYDGSQDIKDKTVLVYGEQGFGDQIQFSRYLNMLTDLDAKVVFACRPQLVKFFTFNFPKIKVYPSTDNTPQYDYHIPLMSLPEIFKTTIDTIPYPEKYLSVRDEAVAKWHKKLGPKSKMRVGITWSGTKVAFITKFRSVPLSEMLILQNSNVELVNVAYDVTPEEKQLMKDTGIIDYSSEFTDFEDNAALIANLDLVVTVDTVTAHLAGALGIPTWVMLADYGCDWRWFLNRTDSPFYSCVKLFRQKGDGKWSPLLLEMHNLLDKLN